MGTAGEHRSRDGVLTGKPRTVRSIKFIGVDTHKESHATVIVDPVGVVVNYLAVPANSGGYAQAIAAVADYEGSVWGVEGAGFYRRCLVDA